MELDCSLKPIIRSCRSRKRRRNNKNNKKGIFLAFPDDIFVEILRRLLDKPLVRLKCVSKAWYFLISQICITRVSLQPVTGLYFGISQPLNEDFQFTKRSAHHHPLSYYFPCCTKLLENYTGVRKFGRYASLNEEGDSGKGQLFEWGESLLSSYGLPFRPAPDELLDCRNGLLLFVDTDSSQYYVSNPVTRQSVLIPRPPCWSQQKSLHDAALAFDPSKSTCYRVVRFERIMRESSLVLDIYSSGSRSWSRHLVQVDPRIRDSVWFRTSVYFDGALFRLSKSWHLIQFDIKEEVSCLWVTELPFTFRRCRGSMGCLGVLNGQLCYANEYLTAVHIFSLDKEVLGDAAGRWILRHKITVYNLPVIAFNSISNIVFLHSSTVILSYNLENDKVERLTRTEKDVIPPICSYPALTYVRFFAPFDEAGNIICRQQQKNCSTLSLN